MSYKIDYHNLIIDILDKKVIHVQSILFYSTN